jgi:ATP-dependent Clp protease ATP-binding subunit ClpA
MNGYNFTQRVRKVLAMTREEAAHLNHEYVGAEHMLLAILTEGEGVASTVLQNLDVDPDALRSTVLNMVKPGQGRLTGGPDLPYTSRAKKVLELAMSEACDLNHTWVGTEHLLLGLAGEAKGIAAQALFDAGVTLEKARGEVLRILNESPFPRAIEPGTSPRERAVIEFVARNATWRRPSQSAQRLKEIIDAARALAVEHQSRIILPAHLTIALLQHPGGMANAALQRLNFNRAAVLSTLNDTAWRGTTPVDAGGDVKLAPEAQTALTVMEQLRRESNAATAGSRHLLLALVTMSPDVDSAFAKQNVSADMIRESVRWLSGWWRGAGRRAPGARNSEEDL